MLLNLILSSVLAMALSSKAEESLEKRKAEFNKILPQLYFQIFLALVTNVLIFYVGYYHCPSIPVPLSVEFTKKVVYTLRCLFPVLLLLPLSVIGVIYHRIVFAVPDPLSGSEHIIQVSKNNLSNTIEQFSILLLSSMILITFLESPEEMRLIPLYSLTFVIGRVLFRLGYGGSSCVFRVWGIHINLQASFFIITLIIYFMATRGFMFGIGDSVLQYSDAATSQRTEL